MKVQDEDVRQAEAVRQGLLRIGGGGVSSKCNRKPVTCFKQDELHYLILDWKTYISPFRSRTKSY